MKVADLSFCILFERNLCLQLTISLIKADMNRHVFSLLLKMFIVLASLSNKNYNPNFDYCKEDDLSVLGG